MVFGFLGGFQLFFEFWHASILNLAHFREILLALSGLEFELRGLDLFLEFGRALHHRFFGLPDFFKIVERAFQRSDLRFQIG